MEIRTSDNINELATALSVAQGEIETAQMNAKNPFLKNRYADLGAIVAVIKPVLPKHGLSYVQMPVTAEGGIGLVTRLMHSSGQWLESALVMPMPEGEKGKSIMQVAGSAITYARRYALAAMFGIVADEDADGNAPPPPQRRQEPPDYSNYNDAAQPAVTNEPPTMTIADIRSTFDELGKFTLGLVANRATMTGLYNANQHALNAMRGYDFPEGVKVQMSQVVSKEGALKVFDWLVDRKATGE